MGSVTVGGVMVGDPCPGRAAAEPGSLTWPTIQSSPVPPRGPLTVQGIRAAVRVEPTRAVGHYGTMARIP